MAAGSFSTTSQTTSASGIPEFLCRSPCVTGLWTLPSKKADRRHAPDAVRDRAAVLRRPASAMRWSIRYQLLTPLLALLLGVVGICTWVAIASANRARHQIETQVRHVARAVHKVPFKLNERVLELMKDLSGADYLLLSADGRQLSTLGA